MTKVRVKMNLAKVLTDGKYFAKMLPKAIEAGAFIVEKAYVKEAPGDTGKYKQSIGVSQSIQNKLQFEVMPNAKNRGFDYPTALYTGTGKQRGKPDAGYTPGRVRAGDVAKGIGGIRPNKVAKRVAANSKVQKQAKNKAERLIAELITKK